MDFRQGNYAQIHTLKEWVYVWIREVLHGVVKPTTIRMYAETMEHHIFPILGEQELQNLSGEKLEDWLTSLSRQSVTGTRTGKMTEGTVRDVLSVLSGSLRDAQKYGLIDHNPCLDVHFFDKKDNSGDCRTWLEPEQVRQLEPMLASYTDEDGYPLGLGFQLVLYTGITLSEAAPLPYVRYGHGDAADAQGYLRYAGSTGGRYVRSHCGTHGICLLPASDPVVYACQ